MRFVRNHPEHLLGVCVVTNMLNSLEERNKMSWLQCDECDGLFNAKQDPEWSDDNGHITCAKCLERLQDQEPYGVDNYLDDEEALASAGHGMDESYGGGDDRL